MQPSDLLSQTLQAIHHSRARYPGKEPQLYQTERAEIHLFASYRFPPSRFEVFLRKIYLQNQFLWAEQSTDQTGEYQISNRAKTIGLRIAQFPLPSSHPPKL